jgi:ABC-type multidrug transport system fused ATPase/permease subunit
LRLHLAILACLSLVSALAEFAGVASVAPFMAVLLNPKELDKLPVIRRALETVGVQTAEESLWWLGVGVCVVVLLNSAITAANTAYQAWFANRVRASVSMGLFERLLRQPYAFHAQTDSATLTKLVFNSVDALTRTVAALLTIGSRLLVIAALLSLLLLQAAGAALIAAVAFGGTYAIVYGVLKRVQIRIGQEASALWARRSRTAIESLGGIKELLVLNRVDVPLYAFADASRRIAGIEAQNTLSGALPRNIIEPIGMTVVIAIALSLVGRTEEGAAGAVATLAVFALVALRLIPSLQQVYAALMEIKYLDWMLVELHSAWQNTPMPAEALPATALDTSNPRDTAAVAPALIEAQGLVFTYPNSDRPALRHVSFRISGGESVGIVGRSGSGKTTLVDLLLGLYRPDGGRLLVDGVALDAAAVMAWRRRVGYVPQHVFLANATIAENVALGLRADGIDRERVTRALEQAQCLEFVQRLPDGLDSFVGERGVKLSGGQRQRIGVARALYHEPEVLILDEATSALDGVTEDAVMKAVNGLRGERTLILIAHRLRTVEACDRLIVLQNGEIVGDASYRELEQRNEAFRALATASSTV